MPAIYWQSCELLGSRAERNAPMNTLQLPQAARLVSGIVAPVAIA